MAGILSILAATARPRIASGQTTSGSGFDDLTVDLLAQRQWRGAIVVRDARTGVILVRAQTDTSLRSSVLPLSTAKLFLAALAWDHDVPANADDLLVRGSDSAGRQLALGLRRKLGSDGVLRQMARYGFPACSAARTVDCVGLDRSTSDTAWANTFSLGESNVRVSLTGLTEFLRAVAGSRPDLISRSTAQRMQSAMYDVVTRGTATSVRGQLDGIGRIGGKTGSGPGESRPTDGIFAGVIADSRGDVRYTFATYIARGGFGGTTAAQISSDVARLLLRETTPTVDACALLYEVGVGARARSRSSLCRTRVSPASTYKIAHALAALDAGVVSGPSDTIRYEGARSDSSSVTARDHTLASALHWSIVWYYQRVAERLGMTRERTYLRRLQYGNADPGSGLTTFWNGGSLAISPVEQERFLLRLYAGMLPVSPRAMQVVREMLIEPPGTITNVTGEHPFGRPWPSNARLSAKTGATTDRHGRGIRWLVGRIDRGPRAFVFVLCVVGPRGISGDSVLELAERQLRSAGVLD